MMQKRLSPLRFGAMAFFCVAAAIGVTSCSKSDDNNNIPDVPVSGLMAFNLSDKQGIGVSLSGSNLVNTALGYTNYTGGYLAVYSGTRQVRSFDANTSATMMETPYTFDSSKYYSLFVAGANNTYQNVLVNDNIDSLANVSNQAYIRYVNTIPDSSKPTVTITGNGQPVINENAAYTAVSGFKAVNAGNVTIAVSNGSNIQASRTITTTASTIYTVLLSGFPGTSDSSKTVQIRYIENGSLSGTQQQRTGNREGARMQ